MRIVNLSYFYDAGLTDPDQLIERYRTTTTLAAELAKPGHEIHVVHRFLNNALVERQGVQFHFVKDRFPPGLKPWQIPLTLHNLVASLEPELVHIHSLSFAAQAWCLRTRLNRACAIVMQDHAGQPMRRFGGVQRQLLKSMDGFLFAADELGESWFDRGVLTDANAIFTVMEGSTEFGPGDSQVSRAKTGLAGAPVLLWVGRLDENKDPLAVLEGFESSLDVVANAQLYMAYGSCHLLPAVRAYIEARPALKNRVHLLGEITHEALEDYYRSADYFVLGSHHEGSGYALCEAMACGVVPVVTDIPSFRMMTNSGETGGLWQPGEAQAFRDCLVGVYKKPLDLESAKAQALFDRRLSFTAIARETVQIYDTVLRRMKG